MKPLILLSALSLLAIVTGCGKANKTSAELEISGGFLVSNTGYGGGLIIVGKNPDANEEFSISLATGKSVSLELTKGKWSFAAIGWEGQGLPEYKFSGQPFCGYLLKDIASDSETVNLTVTPEGCSHPAFASSQYRNPATGNFRQLTVVETCNSFYTSVAPADIVSTRLVNNTTTEGYCGMASSVPEDWKTKVRSIKLYAVTKKPSDVQGTLAFGSECIGNNTDSLLRPQDSGMPYMSKLFRIPTKIPLAVAIYEDTSCSKPITTFQFKDGLEVASTQHDHLLFGRDGIDDSLRLILPGNDLKRAYSPFMAHMPAVRCAIGAKCDTTPSPALPDLHGFDNGRYNTVLLRNRKSCPSDASITNSPMSPMIFTCTEDEDGIMLSYSMSGSEYGSTTITVPAINGEGAVNLTVYIADSLDVSKSDKYQAYNTMIDALGPAGSFNGTFFNYGHNDNDSDKAFGHLGKVREMLGAAGPGGLFPVDPTLRFQENCSAISGSKTVQIYDYDELKYETYKVVIDDTTYGVPSNFTCDPADWDATACTVTSYDKRMYIYDYAFSTVQPTMVMEFTCDTKLMGKMERYEVENGSSESRIQRELIEWVTPIGLYDQHRFEIASWSKERNPSTNAITREYRYMTRVLKVADEDFQISNYSFNSEFNGTDWRENFQSQQIIGTGTERCYLSTNEGLDGLGTLYDLFGSANTDVVTARNALPSYATTYQAAAKRVDLSVAYQSQAPVTGCAIGFVDPMYNENILGIQPKLNSLRNLNSAGFFENVFGTSFFTAGP